MEPGSFESVYPFEIQIDIVVCVESGRDEIVGTSPVVPRGWGRIRWLKRKGMAVCPLV